MPVSEYRMPHHLNSSSLLGDFSAKTIFPNSWKSLDHLITLFLSRKYWDEFNFLIWKCYIIICRKLVTIWKFPLHMTFLEGQIKLIITLHICTSFLLNKHKFVQKVAKRNILLISFSFSASISSVHRQGCTRLNEVKQ